jgi:predicted transcriptional regulator
MFPGGAVMTADSGRAHLDTQSLTDVDTYVYETIATLEYTGRPLTRGQIAAVTDIDDAALDEALGNLVRHGLVNRTDDGPGGEPGFVPAHRGWSAAPKQGRGM